MALEIGDATKSVTADGVVSLTGSGLTLSLANAEVAAKGLDQPVPPSNPRGPFFEAVAPSMEDTLTKFGVSEEKKTRSPSSASVKRRSKRRPTRCGLRW